MKISPNTPYGIIFYGDIIKSPLSTDDPPYQTGAFYQEAPYKAHKAYS